MRHDSRASLLAHNLATPCLGCELEVRVMTKPIGLGRNKGNSNEGKESCYVFRVEIEKIGTQMV